MIQALLFVEAIAKVAPLIMKWFDDKDPAEPPQYFKPHEFACKCGCGADGMDPGFVKRLNAARHVAAIPFTLNSARRCEAHNKAEGGKPGSAHTLGLAADIRCSDGRQRYQVITACLAVGFHRIGVAEEFVHVDLDKTKPPSCIWTY
jgi:hypothetical protein